MQPFQTSDSSAVSRRNGLRCDGQRGERPRRLGVRFVIGIEALGPLCVRYGENGARTVSGLCATWMAVMAADEETAA